MRVGPGCGSGIIVLAWLLDATVLVGQEYSGKLQGHVRAATSEALHGAQVLIPGTAFAATADPSGYYFINNLPVGSYVVRAQLIGYAPAEVREVRIVSGQTTDLDFALQATAITVSAVTISAAENPIVPRDQVTTKTIVPGQLINDLPVDNLRGIITLQPGVVQVGNFAGNFSVRGSRPGEAQIYIDGAPIKPLAAADPSFAPRAGNLTERQMPQIGTNAVEEATVTTGALGAGQGNAQAGAIGYTTRAGGDRFAGAFAYETDEPLGDASQGLNRFEASVGGPIGLEHLRFFVSGVMQGVRSSGAFLTGGTPEIARARSDAGWGWDGVPTFVTGGLDTTVTWTDSSSGHSPQVVIPKFVQVTGTCGTLGSDATPVAQDIRSNYGYACQGGRLPMNWQTNAQLQGKLLYSYGEGSTVALTGLANGTQRRFWPNTLILDPALFQGQHGWSRALILNLSHQVFRHPDQALAINLITSWQEDHLLAGPLDPTYEASSRDPSLGIELGTMRFTGLGVLPYPVTDQIVRNFRTGSGLRTPYDGRDDLRDIQDSRLNPMAMATGGWFTHGFAQDAQTHWERRVTTQVSADWQVDRFNRLTLGGDALWSTAAHWETGNMIKNENAYAFRESPSVYALYGVDRLDLGDVVLEAGLRWDYFNTHALFPKVPGIPYYQLPDWPLQAATNDDSLAAALARATYPGRGHDVVSPRVRVSFPVTDRTDLRLSYGKQVQIPDFFFTYDGNDVDFGQTILYEFGVRHAFTPGTVLDVAFYNKDIRSEVSFRQVKYDDPRNPGFALYEFVPLNVDFGYSRGVDMKLDLRLGSGFMATLGYGFQTSRSTGSDPLAVVNQSIAQVTGDSISLAQAVNVTAFDRTHNVVATLAWTVPAGSNAARALGGVLRNVGVYATGRYQSGLPFTRLNDQLQPVSGINTARLPPLRNVDMRLTKGLPLGGLAATLYLDVRNLFNFRNTISVFQQTGDVTYPRIRENTISDELTGIQNEAAFNGRSNGGAVDVRNCDGWQPNPVNCVMLNRAEARYGNGDGFYTVDEQRRAIGAWYDMINGTQWFYGPPRLIRLGLELSF